MEHMHTDTHHADRLLTNGLLMSTAQCMDLPIDQIETLVGADSTSLNNVLHIVVLLQ